MTTQRCNSEWDQTKPVQLSCSQQIPDSFHNAQKTSDPILTGIERLQAELAALQADSILSSEEFLGYECVDVSMPNLADGDYMLPEIRLLTSKCNSLFQFEKPTGPVLKAAPALPRVLPMSFYQETAVPPSA